MNRACRILGAAWWLVALVPGVAAAADEEAGGEEEVVASEEEPVGRSLAERIPAVSASVFVKRGRVELYPAIGMSLDDAFYNQTLGSLGVSYHVLESLSIGVAGDYYLAFNRRTPVVGGPHPGRPEYNRPAYGARMELAWAPIYGKLSLLAEGVLHFDTYVAVGGGIIAPSATASTTMAGNVAVGQRYFLNSWAALRIEVRDEIFKMARNPDADPKERLQSLLSASVALCFYVPSTFERVAP